MTPLEADAMLQRAQVHLAKNIYAWPVAVWLAAFDTLAHCRAGLPKPKPVRVNALLWDSWSLRSHGR